MPRMLAALAGGCLAGALHVVTGPDHLAAVAPLAARQAGRAWTTGLRWGIGHGAGSAAICAAAWGCGLFAHAETTAAWSERAVGAILIAIGAWSLWRLRRERASGHPHRHGAIIHVHPHDHRPRPLIDLGAVTLMGTPTVIAADPRAAARVFAEPAHAHRHAPFAIGALHGLAGGSHVVALVPALALPCAQSIGFCVAYVGASIVAMVAFAGGMGLVAQHLAGLRRICLGLQVTLAVIAIATGGWWMLR